MKKPVMRMCIVTKDRFEKNDLIRIVKNKNGEIFIDSTGKLNGKGAYLKKDLEVIKKAKVNKILDKALEAQIPCQIYDELLELIGGEQE